ncbi:MAG: hypothetical protein ABIZ80_18895, partial [Bryobacteraceae bacterium]
CQTRSQTCQQSTPGQPAARAYHRRGHRQKEYLRATCITRAGAPDQWDGGWTVTSSELVPFDDQVLLYYGRANGRYSKKTEIGVATLPLDRFAHMKPKRLNGWGVLELKPYHYPEGDVILNADAGKGGEIRVEVLDFDGNAIKGFEKANFVPIRSDGMRHELRWLVGGKNVGVSGVGSSRAIRLRFYLRNAGIFSLRSASNTFGMRAGRP